MRDREFWALLLLCAVGLLIVAAMSIPINAAFANAAPSEPQATATPEPCVPIGSAEGQQLYFCESNFAPDCVWDPSPGLGAGVVDCDW